MTSSNPREAYEPAFIFDGQVTDENLTIALAHGAGVTMDTPFMETIARGLAGGGHRVARFEFPYMQARRATGKRRAPDRPAVLLDAWRAVIERLGDPAPLAIGGKSMGGRMASMVADEAGVRGLVVLGYPFHAAGRPASPRIEHLRALRTPTLIMQGERDPMGNRAEVESYDLSDAIRIHWLADGDHSFRPRKASGHTEQQHLDEAIEVVLDFLRALAP